MVVLWWSYGGLLRGHNQVISIARWSLNSRGAFSADVNDVVGRREDRSKLPFLETMLCRGVGSSAKVGGGGGGGAKPEK